MDCYMPASVKLINIEHCLKKEEICIYIKMYYEVQLNRLRRSIQLLPITD